MKLADIVKLLDAKIYTGQELLETIIEGAYAADLMSDVLAATCIKEKSVLVSGLNNEQLVRTAEMLDLIAIILVRGKEPKNEIIQIANENKIVLMSTEYNMYNSCGMLYQEGIKGLSNA